MRHIVGYFPKHVTLLELLCRFTYDCKVDLFIVATGQKMVGRNFFKVREISPRVRENLSLGKRSGKSDFKSIYLFFSSTFIVL